MLLAIAGVTGVGKSYYKDLLTNELGFEKIRIITTREMRKTETKNEDKIFVSNEELQKLVDKGDIAYKFEMLGNTYAYTKKEVFSDKNTVFEMHYDTIFDWKKVYPNIRTIYLLPNDLDVPKSKLRERNLSPEVEASRIKEIDEHYNRIMTDGNLRNMFDYILYNNYDKASDEKILNVVKGEIKLQEKKGENSGKQLFFIK